MSQFHPCQMQTQDYFKLARTWRNQYASLHMHAAGFGASAACSRDSICISFAGQQSNFGLLHTECFSVAHAVPLHEQISLAIHITAADCTTEASRCTAILEHNAALS